MTASAAQTFDTKAWIYTSCDTEACEEEGWQPSADEPSCAEEAVRLNEGSLGST
jgi:hypothetical protein